LTVDIFAVTLILGDKIMPFKTKQIFHGRPSGGTNIMAHDEELDPEDTDEFMEACVEDLFDEPESEGDMDPEEYSGEFESEEDLDPEDDDDFEGLDENDPLFDKDDKRKNPSILEDKIIRRLDAVWLSLGNVWMKHNKLKPTLKTIITAKKKYFLDWFQNYDQELFLTFLETFSPDEQNDLVNKSIYNVYKLKIEKSNPNIIKDHPDISGSYNTTKIPKESNDCSYEDLYDVLNMFMLDDSIIYEYENRNLTQIELRYIHKFLDEVIFGRYDSEIDLYMQNEPDAKNPKEVAARWIDEIGVLVKKSNPEGDDNENKEKPDDDPDDDEESIMHRYYNEPSRTTVTIWFDKDKYSSSRAKVWLREHGYKSSGMKVTDGFFAFPQMSPAVESKYSGKILSKYIAPGILLKFVPAGKMKNPFKRIQNIVSMILGKIDHDNTNLLSLVEIYIPTAEEDSENQATNVYSKDLDVIYKSANVLSDEGLKVSDVSGMNTQGYYHFKVTESDPVCNPCHSNPDENDDKNIGETKTKFHVRSHEFDPDSGYFSAEIELPNKKIYRFDFGYDLPLKLRIAIQSNAIYGWRMFNKIKKFVKEHKVL
jgi:hypothetical protein